MSLPSRYQKSKCKGDFLHKWKLTQEDYKGVLERCERCGHQMYFPMDVPNEVYLSYHIRSILRADDPLFRKEYPEINL